MIESKNLGPIENIRVSMPSSQQTLVSLMPEEIAMKMILLYFVMCGFQGIATAIVLSLVQRNPKQMEREKEYIRHKRTVTDLDL